MEKNNVNFGSSFLLPSVKELAKNVKDDVPDRYIQQYQIEEQIVKRNEEVPLIDLQRLISDDHSELAKFHHACQHWGFFQLVNHGVENSLLMKIKEEVKDFFNLPMEEKKKYWQYEGELEGFGQAFVFSEDKKLEWADLFFLVTLPYHARKPHLFPNLPLPLRESLDSYANGVKSLAMKLLSIIAKNLDAEEEEITGIFEEGHQSMRMNYYPPCPQHHKVIGLTPHSDASGLTILLQLNQVEGLQIKKDGNWIPINPLPNAFVINVGDILEIMTNGMYRSIEHRAMVNPEKERLSIASFYAPSYEAEMGPVPSLINLQNPALFRRTRVDEYFRAFFSRELRSKSFLDYLRI